MSPIKFAFLFLLAGAGLTLAPGQARAAESLDTCAGYITTLPTVITTQGVWCMSADATTPITSGNAILVQTNNVTIDCNNFKLGGLAAGTGTATVGIMATSLLNLTVRNCIIRGFKYGVRLTGGGGHLIEDSTFDGITYDGIYASSDGLIVRNNAFYNTGGSTTTNFPAAMDFPGATGAVVTGNTINGIFAANTFTDSNAAAIYAAGCSHCVIADNNIVDVVSNGVNNATGIYSGSRNKVMRNTISALFSPGGNEAGITCASSAMIAGNLVTTATPGFEFQNTCVDAGGNASAP